MKNYTEFQVREKNGLTKKTVRVEREVDRELLKQYNRHGLLIKSNLKGRGKEKHQSNYRENSIIHLCIDIRRQSSG